MKKDIEQKLRSAKIKLEDLLMIYPQKELLQKDIIFALEAIDDALEGKVRFPKKSH